METSILSGLEASKALYSSLESRISHLKDRGIVPGLAAVLVGNNPASEIYVKNKTKKFESLGLKTDVFRLEETVSEDELLSLIIKLNTDSEFHGILVQLPLPKHIDSEKVLNAIIPTKDVDGFHPENAGLLSIGKPRFVPCTPKGIMFILRHFNIDLNGKHVVVIGRSNIVGRPISILASLKELGNATVTLCHSGTKDLKYFSKQADVLVAALGSPEFVDSSYIKEGACLVDVGINRIEIDGKSKIVGDVNQDSVTGIASSLTPVPKGVGPMTIAMLVENTVLSAELLLNWFLLAGDIMYKKLLFIILPFLLFSCTSNVDEAEVKKARQFFESVFQDSVLDSPEFQASLGYKSNYDKWDDITWQASRQRAYRAKDDLDYLEKNIYFDKLD